MLSHVGPLVFAISAIPCLFRDTLYSLNWRSKYLELFCSSLLGNKTADKDLETQGFYCQIVRENK